MLMAVVFFCCIFTIISNSSDLLKASPYLISNLFSLVIVPTKNISWIINDSFELCVSSSLELSLILV